jgi:HEPN domain-containing protein
MNNAEKWLKIAHKDFQDASIAELSIENRLYHCQQAAEKALKAVLVYHEKNYPFTHDISDLIATIQNHNISTPEKLI